MANRLNIVISGRKSSGKSSLGKYIFCEYINRKIGQKRFVIEKSGKDIVVLDTFKNNAMIPVDSPTSVEAKQLADTYSVKIYSFADPLKAFCIDVLGLDHSQCYGSDDDKNSITHISWDNIDPAICAKYSKKRRGSGGIRPAAGMMTAREVMQVFGTEICRKIDENCWVRGVLSQIEKEGYTLAIVADGRFPNEISMTSERGAKTVRLLRNILDDDHDSEHALDNFPLGNFSKIVDNEKLTLEETHKEIKPDLINWFDQYGVM